MVALACFFFPLFRARMAELRQQPEYQLTTDSIHLDEIPHWVPQDLLQQVIRQSDLPTTFSLLDDSLVQTLAEAFEQHPWVDSVESVRKHPDAGIEVKLNYRQPVAMVEVSEGLLPIDGSAVLLPPIDFSYADTQRYPHIEGTITIPDSEVGKVWEDRRIQGAARIAAALQTEWQELKLKSILLPIDEGSTDEADALSFVLKTEGGSRIHWGRAPESGHPGELTVAQKIGRLQQYLQQFGSFDAPHGPYEIDIRHWQEISRRPTTASRESRERR